MAANAVRNMDLHRALELIEEIPKIGEGVAGEEGGSSGVVIGFGTGLVFLSSNKVLIF
jgi:hypothetical protein